MSKHHVFHNETDNGVVIEYDRGTSRDKSPSYFSTDCKLSANLNLFHQNVCGLGNKVHDLEVYIDSLSKCVHYICISEHFLTNLSAPLLTVSNYSLAAHNSRTNKTRGGTLILASNNRDHAEVLICKKLYKMEYFEITGINDTLTNVNVCCLYRNPVDNNFISFMEQLEKLLEYFVSKKCIICGDFNVNFTNEEEN